MLEYKILTFVVQKQISLKFNINMIPTTSHFGSNAQTKIIAAKNAGFMLYIV